MFDVQVTDSDAASYVDRPVSSVLATAEEEKRKYLPAAQLRHAFNPFVVSIDGALGHEALMFLQWLSDRLASSWVKGYSYVFPWVRVHLAFTIIQATSLCLHGSHVRWRSATIVRSC